MFEELEIGAALFPKDGWPLVVHAHHSILDLEVQQGVLDERLQYNAGCLERARRENKAVRGTYAGLSDLFVPIDTGGPAPVVLVSGPFATAPLATSDILERWRALTARQGNAADPEFMHYLTASLSTLVLDAKHLPPFQRMLEMLAALMAGRGSTHAVMAEVDSLQRDLRDARLAERIWEAVGLMLHEGTSRVWSDRANKGQLAALGLRHFPEHMAVGLFVDRKLETDPIEGLVRRRAYQRACVELALSTGKAASGRLGDHGVIFLLADGGGARQARAALDGLVDMAASLAKRRFGLSLHVGISMLSSPLPEQFVVALAAAESALAHRMRSLRSDQILHHALSPAKPVRELAAILEENPTALPARFDVFMEGVAARSGYMLERARGHLEAAFARMMEVMRDSGTMGPKGLDGLESSVKRAAAEAPTVSELLAVYRRAARDMAAAAQEPTEAHRDQSLRRGVEYVRRHYAEPLSLKRVARVAGFAPNYFSELFRKKQRMTFANYLMQRRLERAKELLWSTSLNLSRVAQLSGLSTRQHLARVFKRSTGMTPVAYRKRERRRTRPWS
jgi:AraC-like DNA-binding protein